MPYIKLMQNVLQQFYHIGSNLFVPICCSTANFDTIFLQTIDHSFETIQFQPFWVTIYPYMRDMEVQSMTRLTVNQRLSPVFCIVAWGVTPTIIKQMDFGLFFCTSKQQCSIGCINPMNNRIKELLLDGIECWLTDESYISDIHNFFYALKCITRK